MSYSEDRSGKFRAESMQTWAIILAKGGRELRALGNLKGVHYRE